MAKRIRSYPFGHLKKRTATAKEKKSRSRVWGFPYNEMAVVSLPPVDSVEPLVSKICSFYFSFIKIIFNLFNDDAKYNCLTIGANLL